MADPHFDEDGLFEEKAEARNAARHDGSHYYKGSVERAISDCRARQSFLVIFIKGGDQESYIADETLHVCLGWQPVNCVALRIHDDLQDTNPRAFRKAKAFREIFPDIQQLPFLMVLSPTGRPLARLQGQEVAKMASDTIKSVATKYPAQESAASVSSRSDASTPSTPSNPAVPIVETPTSQATSAPEPPPSFSTGMLPETDIQALASAILTASRQAARAAAISPQVHPPEQSDDGIAPMRLDLGAPSSSWAVSDSSVSTDSQTGASRKHMEVQPTAPHHIPMTRPADPPSNCDILAIPADPATEIAAANHSASLGRENHTESKASSAHPNPQEVLGGRVPEGENTVSTTSQQSEQGPVQKDSFSGIQESPISAGVSPAIKHGPITGEDISSSKGVVEGLVVSLPQPLATQQAINGAQEPLPDARASGRGDERVMPDIEAYPTVNPTASERVSDVEEGKLLLSSTTHRGACEGGNRSGSENMENGMSAKNLPELKVLQQSSSNAQEHLPCPSAEGERGSLIERGKAEQAKQAENLLVHPPHLEGSPRAASPKARMACLAFRLINGNFLRSDFPDDTALSAVFDYVDRHRTDGRVPYVLRTPFPYRYLDRSQGLQKLRSLDLYPRALLVLQPSKATSRMGYSSIGASVDSITRTLHSWLTAFLAVLFGIFSGLLSNNQKASRATSSQSDTVVSLEEGPPDHQVPREPFANGHYATSFKGGQVTQLTSGPKLVKGSKQVAQEDMDESNE